MEKILTIIVPTYNMEKYLDKCLTSLVVSDEQMKQLEVLVINDGSKDRSSVIAHSYENRYPSTFRVIDKENGNYGSCVNRGLKETTGKYVKILDADDSFDTYAFEHFMCFLAKVDSDMIVSPFCYVDPQGQVVGHHSYKLHKGIQLEWKDVMKAFKETSLQMHAVAYRAQTLKELNYRQTEGISYTDQEWIFTPLFSVQTITYYNKELYRYLLGREGQTMDAQYQKRDVSHNEKCVRRIINDYHFDKNKYNLKWTEAHQQYIFFRFRLSIAAIYYKYLIDYRDLPIENLIAFDDYVKKMDQTYCDMMDDEAIKGTSFHYIREWHKNREKRPNNIIITSLLLYCKIRRIMAKFRKA